MAVTATVAAAQFARRTTLTPTERRINFHQLDHDVIVAVSSDEAAQVTDKMAKIYLRLVAAPRDCWQAEGVLCFEGEPRGDKWVTGYDRLIELLGVSGATAAKALAWMSEKGIIGYSSPKNGHPTRIWLNRAAASIAEKPAPGRANLRLVPPQTTAEKAGLFFSPAASKNEPAFKEEHEHEFRNYYPTAALARVNTPSVAQESADNALLSELESLRREVAQKPSAANLLAAVSAAVRAEIEDQLAYQFNQTREWLKEKAIPQAARISQAETYKILEKQGTIRAKRDEKAGLYVGAPAKMPATQPQASGALSAADPVMQAAEAVWLLADLQQQDLETALDRVLRDLKEAQEGELSEQFVQAICETISGEAIHAYIRAKLDWWNPLQRPRAFPAEATQDC